jgi:hypothetical protein
MAEQRRKGQEARAESEAQDPSSFFGVGLGTWPDVSQQSGSGHPVQQQVPMLIHRSGQWSDADDVVVDLYHLSDGPYGPFTDYEPGTLADERRVSGLIEERPRQAGVVFAVEVDHLLVVGREIRRDAITPHFG